MAKNDVEDELRDNKADEITLRDGLAAYDAQVWYNADIPGANITITGGPNQDANLYLRKAIIQNKATILAAANALAQADIDAAEALVSP